MSVTPTAAYACVAERVLVLARRGVLHVLLDQLVKFGIIMLACSPFIGGIAWAVPNALCKVPMEQSMANGGGGSGGFFDCLYMKHMDWKGAPTLTTLVSAWVTVRGSTRCRD